MRTFVSLTLPEPRRARLLKLLEDMRSQGALKGRAVRAKNLHLTLAFIGDIDAGTAGRLAARIAEIEPVDLRFEFSHTGAFRSGILWAGLEEKEKFEALAALIFDGLSGLLPVFCMILSIGILCGILNRFKSSFSERGTARLIFLMSYGAVLVLILSSLSGVIADCISAVSSMRSQMQAIFPVLLTLIVTCGGNVSAAVYRPAALFLSDGIVQVITAAVFPLAVLVCVLHMAGHMNSEIRLQNFTSFFGSIIKWVLGISLTAFSVFLTVQGITSATYDGISFKAAKYALGNSVPMIGGFLSGGLDLVLAGGVLIKNSVGMCGVLLLVIVIAAPLVQLVVYNLFLKLTAAVTEPVGAEGVSGFLSSLSGAVNYFIAGLLAVGFMYFMTVLLLICSSNAMF